MAKSAPGGCQRGEPGHDDSRDARTAWHHWVGTPGQGRKKRKERQVALQPFGVIVSVLDDADVPVAVRPTEKPEKLRSSASAQTRRVRRPSPRTSVYPANAGHAAPAAAPMLRSKRDKKPRRPSAARGSTRATANATTAPPRVSDRLTAAPTRCKRPSQRRLGSRPSYTSRAAHLRSVCVSFLGADRVDAVHGAHG